MFAKAVTIDPERGQAWAMLSRLFGNIKQLPIQLCAKCAKDFSASL
jgi:hypothetical protein